MSVRVFVKSWWNVRIRAEFLQNLQECLGDRFSHFEAMNKAADEVRQGQKVTANC